MEQDLNFVALKGDDIPSEQIQSDMCKGLRNNLEKSKSTLALFPSEESTPVYHLALTSKTLDMQAIGTARLLNLMVIGCVVYRSEFAEEIHETGYAFEIRE